MENFSLCFEALMPMLLLCLLGYFLKQIKFIPQAGFDAIDKLCIQILVPVLLFQNVYNADFSTEFDLGAAIFVVGVTVVLALAAMLLVPRLMPGSRENIATVVHGVCHGNLAVLGIPLIGNLFGDSGLAVYSILLSFGSPVVNALMVFEHIYYQGEKIRPFKLLADVIKSPCVLGTLLGFACKLLGVQFPTFIQTAVTDVKSIASPLCLIALGTSFSFGSIKGMAGPVIHSVLAKCVWIPAVVLGIAVALGFRGTVLASLMVLFCCPCSTSVYSYCTGYGGNPRMASLIVVYSTAFSIVSMFLWIFAFLQLGLF